MQVMLHMVHRDICNIIFGQMREVNRTAASMLKFMGFKIFFKVLRDKTFLLAGSEEDMMTTPSDQRRI